MPSWDDFLTAFRRPMRDLVDTEALWNSSALVTGSGGVGRSPSGDLACSGVGHMGLGNFDTRSVTHIVGRYCDARSVGSPSS